MTVPAANAQFTTEPEPAPQPRVLHILPALGSAGAEIMAASLMVPLAHTYEVAAAALYRRYGGVMEATLRREGVRFWALDKRSGPDPRMFGGLHRIIRDFAPDVIHTHLYVLRYVLPVALWRRKSVIIHTVHNVAERESDCAGRLLQRVAFGRWVTPVAVSRNVARSMARVYGIENAVTIPNGIPVRQFAKKSGRRERWRKAEGFDENAVLFIATGRLTKQKNPWLLLRSFAAMRDPHAHLILVGDGALQDPVSQEVRALGMGDRVRILGRRNDVADCLAAADIFVLSSDWEGNPLGVMEAMASGLPVISTSVGGVPELVESGRHGLLVRPRDDAALAAAMRTLLDDAELRLALGGASRERASAEFGVERMVRAYDDLYARLMAERRTPQ